MRKVPIQLGSEVAYNLEGDPGEIRLSAPRGSITDREADILMEYARERSVLEIGTGTGFSSEQMVTVAKSVTTVDIDPWVIENVFPYLSALGIRCLEKSPDQGVFDMVFLDGSHIQEDVIRDIETAVRLTRPGAVVFLHDLHLPGVAMAARASGLDVERFGTSLHLALWRR